MREHFIDLNEMSKEDIADIMGFIKDPTNHVDATKGNRVYFPLKNLSIKCPRVGHVFDQIAEEVLRIIGQGTGFLRMKNQDVVIGSVTKDDEILVHISKMLLRLQQMGHLDVVDTIKGIPEYATLFKTVFEKYF